jgi:hypothetical protein
MTRTTFLNGAWTSDERKTIEAAVRNHFLYGPATEVQREKCGQFIERLDEIISAERHLFQPTRLDDKKRHAVLIELEQRCRRLGRIIGELDEDTASSLRWQNVLSRGSLPQDIVQFNHMLSSLKLNAEALEKSANSLINRKDRRAAVSNPADLGLGSQETTIRRNERDDKAPKSFLKGFVRAHYEVFSEKPSSSRESKFIVLLNDILRALSLPPVGEERLKMVIDAMIKSDELPAARLKPGPKPRSRDTRG